MNTVARTFAFTLLAALAVVSLVTAPSAAAEPKLLLVHPGDGPTLAPHLPKFGFSSFSVHGVGERVTHVRWGGTASQLGLEPGDLLLSMNGFPLTYKSAWNDALHSAMVHNGGWVRLRIRDVRTGLIAQRQAFVGGGGPVVHHYHTGGNTQHIGLPNGPITQKSIVGRSNGGVSPQPHKKIAKLLD